MLFNSFHFILFFIVVTALYFFVEHKQRWNLLLAASCYFYMVFLPVYILILGFTIVVDYFAGIYIERTLGKKRKILLICSLIANIGVLAVFKYYNFLTENISLFLNSFGYENNMPYLSILLPVGLSFHTFQAMSYTIEVYRGNQKAEQHFGIYSLYVMFYPQLVAGPIERPQNILHQLHEKKEFNYDQVVSGLQLMLWGFFKKVVIADRLALITDPVFNQLDAYGPGSIFIAVLFFTFQIFCDFSGYSDIALGTARVMGFKLMQNFNRPYHAQSISEFWSRWHISLSTWFKDYLYISLGGNRVSIPRWYFNLFFVFLVSGLWHGANWTFICWGALHGFYLVFGLVADKLKKYLKPFSFIYTNLFWNVGITFLLVMLSWVWFRAHTIQDALFIYGQLGQLLTNPKLILNLTLNRYDLWVGICAILFLELVHLMQTKININQWFNQKALWIKWGMYYLVLFLMLYFGVYEKKEFIYFQF